MVFFFSLARVLAARSLQVSLDTHPEYAPAYVLVHLLLTTPLCTKLSLSRILCGMR